MTLLYLTLASFWRWLWQYLFDLWTWRRATLQVQLNPFRPQGTSEMAKKAAAGTNLQWPELASDGITISLKDAGGNPAPLPDPTTVKTTYACSDPTVVAMTADPTTPFSATGKSTGKVGVGLTISCTLAFNSGAPSITGVSAPFDVPPGAPSSVDVNLGTPA
mgnify:CR=1 FL=1